MRKCKHQGGRVRWGVSNATCCVGLGAPFEVLRCKQPEVADFENGECCRDGEVWNLRNCSTCELKEFDDFTPDDKYQQRLKWSVVMRLAPRETRYVDATIASLAAGWKSGTIYCEPGVRPPAIDGWRVVSNRETLGSFRNFCKALRGGLDGEPDAILSVEDDIVLCRGLMQWLESVLWPSPDVGVVSLYTASHQTGRATHGDWMRQQDGPAWGTLAQVFRPEFVRSMLDAELSQYWHSPIGEDQFVSQSCELHQRSLLSCVPSLVQHVGDAAAIARPGSTAADGKRAARDFVGEDYDARERINGKAVEWARPIETPEEASVEDAVMFGITHFDRPEALRKCVASIRQYYPRAEIVVANNGRLTVPMVGVEQLDLPFDCGISAARNALADHCGHQYYAIFEEDFELIDFSRMGALLHVLRADDSIAMAAGSLIQNGTVLNYDRDLRRRSDGWLFGEYPAADVLTTPGGVSYRPCDMVLNFGICRSKWAREIRWDEELKVGEHFEFFMRSQAAGYRVAHVPGVVARHARIRPAGYGEFRNRAKQMHQLVYQKHGLRGHTIENDDERVYPLPAGTSPRGPVRRVTNAGTGTGTTETRRTAVQ